MSDDTLYTGLEPGMGNSEFLNPVPRVCPKCEGKIIAGSGIHCGMGMIGMVFKCVDCHQYARVFFNQNAVKWGIIVNE